MRAPQHDAEDVGVTAVDEQQPSARSAQRSRLLAALRYGAPALAALALVLVIGGDPGELDNDLHVSLPDTAPKSGALPMRGMVYTRLRQPDGPALARVPIDVEAQTIDGRSLARTRLEPAASDLQGMLQLPEFQGPLQIIARARQGDHALEVRTVLANVATPGPVPVSRPLRALQQFAAGPIQAIGGAHAPSPLALQVRGGACIPEQPCQLLLHVGEPAAAIVVEPNTAVTPSSAARSGSAVERGVIELEIVTHGPEAELWLRAERDGAPERPQSARDARVPVARRAVRLPIAMAAVGLRANTWLPSRSSEFRLRGLDVDAGSASGPASPSSCIVDLFRDGHWVATGALANCAEPSTPPFALQPGVQRVQLRRDPFSTQTAGVMTIYLRGANETAEQIAAALAAAAEPFAPSDAVVLRCKRAPSECSAPGWGAYLAALLDAGIYELPPAVSGYAASLARSRERQQQLRSMALLALALGAGALAFSIGRSGWTAGQRASLVSGLGDASAARSARMRSLLVVAASVCSLVLVFVVLALYVVARGGT